MSTSINDSYKITGPIISIAEHAKNRPGMVIKASEEQIAEVKLHDEQVQAREEVNRNYAKQHPVKVYGQVVVEGKLFATAYESGSVHMPYQMKLSEDGFGSSLAETRLNEIAKAVNGTIIYSDFFPDPGGTFWSAPESILPPVTARGLIDFVDEMRWEVERARIDASQKQDTTP